MEYGKFCYFIQNKELQGKSWRDASLSCQDMGAYLLSIEDDAENFFVGSILNDRKQNDKYWIGLNDAVNNREFTWSDNTYPRYFNWLPKKPNNRGQGENCVETNIYGWNDDDCSNFHGFICKSVKVYNGSCADGWVNYKNQCYFFKKKDATYSGSNWEDSYISCRDKGGDLLSVEDQEENLFVTSVLENDIMIDQNFWIGLNYLQSYKKFVWSDNTHSKFFYWNPKVPNQNILNKSNFSNGVTRCTVVNADSWDIQDCRDEKKYICKVKRETNTSCANDWFENASYCYYFQSKKFSQQKLEGFFLSCLQKGGNLLSVDDQTENEFIINVLKSNKMNQDYWIGLTDRWYNTWFMWSDHTYLQYANPKFFKYMDLDLFDDCVRISKHYWDTKMCASLNGFICKVRRASNFCAENWVGFRRHCYFIQKVEPCGYSGNHEYSGNTWAESFLICQFKGGNLLSIEDQEEDLFIQNLIQDDCQYWIGLNKDWNYGKFVWSDNTYSQFFNWIENHQTDKNKNCVEMNSNGWNVNECNVSNGFICKVKKDLSRSLYTNSNSLVIYVVVLPVLVVIIAVIMVVAVLKLRRQKSQKLMNLDPYTIDDYNGYDQLADEWEIFPEDIVLDKKIGEGAFGTVFIAKLNSSVSLKRKQKSNIFHDIMESSSNVAVKLVNDSADPSELNDFSEEMNLMKEIGYHKNIVNLIGCSTIKTPLCLVVEYMEHGDLLNFLRKKRTKFCASKDYGRSAVNFMYTQGYQQSLKPTTKDSFRLGNDISFEDNEVITPDDLLSFAWQVASGMEYLSCCKLVHRDLAARNVLVGAGKLIKISDFGLSRKVNDELNYMSKKKRPLPVKWMSVEAIFDQTFTSFSDVWAYGVVLFEIVTLGGAPYPTISNRELLPLLKSGYRMDRPENCSEAMYNIMLQCWNKDPLQRPTFTMLRDHFDGVMSQGDCYFSFEFDENYAPSFLPFQTEDDDNEVADEIFQNPVRVKGIEEMKKLSNKMISLSDGRYANVT